MGPDRSKGTKGNASTLGRAFSIAVLACAAGALTLYASSPLAFRGSSFVTGIGGGAGPLYLAFAVALAAAGTAALVRNDFSTLALFALVPSLAVAAADSGFTFYLSMRQRYSGSGFATTHVHLTLATWGALCLALVGGATVLVATARLRGSAVFRRDLVVAALAILCAAALATALLLNRYRVSRERFGGIFFGLRSSTQPLDSAVIFARGVIVLVAVAGGVLLAGALGRSRAASLLLPSAAFGALLVDSDWLRSSGPFFNYLPAFALLIAGACGATLVAGWCWPGERPVSTPERATVVPA